MSNPLSGHALRVALSAADLAGDKAGTDAAVGFVTRDNAEAIMAGLIDGDPEVLDTFPNTDTVGIDIDHVIYAARSEVGVSDAAVRLELWNVDTSAFGSVDTPEFLDQMWEAFGNGFEPAVSAKIESDAIDTLRDMAIERVESLTVWHLANLAACDSPATIESPGALFLLSVRDETLSAIRESDPMAAFDPDRVVEIADNAPDVYTYPMWQQFVDLAAWQEDLEDSVSDFPSMEHCARVALFQIAERLAGAIVETITTLDD